jgi:hypothetical protein
MYGPCERRDGPAAGLVRPEGPAVGLLRPDGPAVGLVWPGEAKVITAGTGAVGLPLLARTASRKILCSWMDINSMYCRMRMVSHKTLKCFRVFESLARF